MVLKPIFGNNLSIDFIDSTDDYILISMEEPWNLLSKKVSINPKFEIFNYNMDVVHLSNLIEGFETLISETDTIIGIGGGTACDTAKYFAWYLKERCDISIDLILIPSIISVDAFLCSSIAVRNAGKVEYIGETQPKKILVDYELIKQAPKILNRAGVSDTISITSALGDWKIEREEINGRFDSGVFHQAKDIVKALLNNQNEINLISSKGIKTLVESFYKEVELCEKWGNARPEEGSEHFLAYCLESITKDHYIHGKLIGMNILISLFLQQSYAEYSIEQISQFFQGISLDVSPKENKLSNKNLKEALQKIKAYVTSEDLMYSIYNSPKLILNKKKINEIIKFINKITDNIQKLE